MSVIWVIVIPIIVLMIIAKIVDFQNTPVKLVILGCALISAIIANAIIGNDFAWQIVNKIGLRNSNYVDLALQFIRSNLAVTTSILLGTLLIFITRFFARNV